MSYIFLGNPYGFPTVFLMGHSPNLEILESIESTDICIILKTYRPHFTLKYIKENLEYPKINYDNLGFEGFNDGFKVPEIKDVRNITSKFLELAQDLMDYEGENMPELEEEQEIETLFKSPEINHKVVDFRKLLKVVFFAGRIILYCVDWDCTIKTDVLSVNNEFGRKLRNLLENKVYIIDQTLIDKVNEFRKTKIVYNPQEYRANDYFLN